MEPPGRQEEEKSSSQGGRLHGHGEPVKSRVVGPCMCVCYTAPRLLSQDPLDFISREPFQKDRQTRKHLLFKKKNHPTEIYSPLPPSPKKLVFESFIKSFCSDFGVGAGATRGG